MQAGYNNQSLCLYTKLGFRTREPLSLVTGSPPRVRLSGYNVRSASKEDIDASAEATAALINSLSSLTERNRVLAVDALLRDADRATALLDAIKAGKVSATVVNGEQRKRLLAYPDDAVRSRAAHAFPS